MRSLVVRYARCMLCVCAVLTGSCGSGTRLLRAGGESIESIRRMEDRYSYEASARIEVSVEGERLRTDAEVVWYRDSFFACTVFDPFGGAIARMECGESLGTVEIGASTYVFGPGDTVRLPSVFPALPFSFDRLIRILTGRLPDEFDFGREVDSLWSRRRDLFFQFRTDSTRTVFRVDRRGDVAAVRAEYGLGSERGFWETEYREFEDGMPEAIRVTGSSKDYFALSYDRIIFLHKEN